MRIGLQRGLSVREQQSMREFREFVAAEEAKAREDEDRREYEKYVAELRPDIDEHGNRIAEGLKPTPLIFEEFQKLLPADEPNAELRGLIATNKALQQTKWREIKDDVGEAVANRELADDELNILGFDLRQRMVPPYWREGDVYQHFVDSHTQYDSVTHCAPLSEFLERNSLQPTARNLDLAFRLLLIMALIEPKPEPEEPERKHDPNVNAYGVNLAIDYSAVDQRKKYLTDIVVVDPRDGRGYTQYQLDHVIGADTYKRLTMGENFIPTIRAVIKPNVK